MDSYTIEGTVMKMELQNSEVINYGTIMHLQGSDISVKNNGTIMKNATTVIHRVETDDDEGEVQRLKAELRNTKRKLSRIEKENRELKAYIEKYKKYFDTEILRNTEDKLRLVMEVNHAQAERIKMLEKGVADIYLREQIDAWDIRPTKQQCADLLRCMENFINTEDYDTIQDFSQNYSIDR